MLSNSALARELAQDIPSNAYVNLGIGLPTLVAEHLVDEQNIILHTENGMLRMGPEATGLSIDTDLVNAGKIPVTELSGASYFHQADSFAMIRGGHIDLCVLGAFQVSHSGNLANWHSGSLDAIPSVGGAMDLAAGAREIYVIMKLFDKNGRSKLVPECTYPLTGTKCVSRVYTELGVFSIHSGERPELIRAFTDDIDSLLEKTGSIDHRGGVSTPSTQ